MGNGGITRTLWVVQTSEPIRGHMGGDGYIACTWRSDRFIKESVLKGNVYDH